MKKRNLKILFASDDSKTRFCLEAFNFFCVKYNMCYFVIIPYFYYIKAVHSLYYNCFTEIYRYVGLRKAPFANWILRGYDFSNCFSIVLPSAGYPTAAYSKRIHFEFRYTLRKIILQNKKNVHRNTLIFDEKVWKILIQKVWQILVLLFYCQFFSGRWKILQTEELKERNF